MEDEELLTQEEMEAIGLEPDQVLVLKRCFDGFADEEGAIPADNVGGILAMMGMKVSKTGFILGAIYNSTAFSTAILNIAILFFIKVKPSALREIIEDIDEDGSGLLEFGEFCQLAAKFLVEEDEEALKKELKEAFRLVQFRRTFSEIKNNWILSITVNKHIVWINVQCSLFTSSHYFNFKNSSSHL